MKLLNRALYLCAGLQSSGSTLVSWCFLQRRDMDGVLDANCEVLADTSLFPLAARVWLKTTIVSFRLAEQVAHFQDLGWMVKPLLVCRDMRAVYASLRTKKYGRNGTTAEDPPLRLRCRRFYDDWELFQRQGWPIVQLEKLVAEPESVLRAASADLGLPWDEAMLHWPKPRSAFWNYRHGNATFHRTRGETLWSALEGYQLLRKAPLVIPPSELEWLETEFAAFNRVNGYPAHMAAQPGTRAEQEGALPRFQVSRRYARGMWRAPWQYALPGLRKACRRLTRRLQASYLSMLGKQPGPRPSQAIH